MVLSQKIVTIFCTQLLIKSYNFLVHYIFEPHVCLVLQLVSKKSSTLYMPWNSKHNLGKLKYKPEWTAILFNHPSIWTANIWWAMTLWCITRHFSGLRLGPDVPLCDTKNIYKNSVITFMRIWIDLHCIVSKEKMYQVSNLQKGHVSK